MKISAFVSHATPVLTDHTVASSRLEKPWKGGFGEERDFSAT